MTSDTRRTDPRLPRRHPRRRCGDPAVAAVAVRGAQVPARPHRQRRSLLQATGRPARAADRPGRRPGRHRRPARRGRAAPSSRARRRRRARRAVPARLDGRDRPRRGGARRAARRRRPRLVRRRPGHPRLARLRPRGARGVEAARAGLRVDRRASPRPTPSTAFGYVRSGRGAGPARTRRASGTPSGSPRSPTSPPRPPTSPRASTAGTPACSSSRAGVLLDHLAEQRPALHDGLRTLAAAWDTARPRARCSPRCGPGLEKIAIDHAIAEPVAAAGGVAVVPGDFGWDDVGDFASLSTLLPPAVGRRRDESPGCSATRPGRARWTRSARWWSRRRTAWSRCWGIDDVVVVDTPDALLVTTRARAQQVKDVVAAVRRRGPRSCCDRGPARRGAVRGRRSLGSGPCSSTSRPA